MSMMSVYPMSGIAGIVDGICYGDPSSHHVRSLLTDSRQLLYPATTLFFALKTRKNDGHRYVEELLSKGVMCFVVEEMHRRLAASYPDACFIVVEDTLQALQKLATHHRDCFTGPVLAITGSNGKTVVKEWLYQLLQGRYQVVKNPKSFNSQLGVPLSVWLISEQHEMAMFEAGISRPGEMDRLRNILKPDIGLFTNIGPAHDEGFVSRKEKIKEKLSLFRGCKVLIYCADQQEVDKEVKSWHNEYPTVKLFTWGLGIDNHLRLMGREKSAGQTLLTVQSKTEQFMVSIPFTDDASIENAMHCLAFMKHMQLENDYIIRKMAELQRVAMRLEMKEGLGGATLINDSYNSDLHSLAIALDFLESQSGHERKTLILSDIHQSGIPADQLYKEVAAMVRSKGVDRLIGIGPHISSHAREFSIPAVYYHDTMACIAELDIGSFRNEAVLLKGARDFGFEKISQILQQKDHQTILEIKLDAIVHNLNVFRSVLEPGVKTMGVVKAFSYGSGGLEVARMLQYHQVDYLAVAYADEGKELRDGGVDIPIMVMNPEVRTFDTLIRHRLEPEIYGFSVLYRLLNALHGYKRNLGDKPLPVHIKLDSGMHRLGFLTKEIGQLINHLRKHPEIFVASVFSHLAASEDKAHDEFTREQINVFDSVCQDMERQLGYPFIRHICNSAAISRFPDAHMDMVRLGIGLYGVSGDLQMQSLLQEVSTFKSVISQVKEINKGDAVGYGRAGKVMENMRIAIVPVGYADGLNRRLGNGRGKLLIGDQKAPLVGHISMDMCVIDVTGLDVSEGEEVIIFGLGLPVSEMANDLDTIPYEVFTSVSRRVKRVYYQE